MSAIANDSLSQAAGMPRLRVLIADDDVSMRELLSHALRVKGYESLTTGNGRTAREIARRRRPSIIFTDALMPFSDGRELFRRVKDEAPDTRVLLMTSVYKSAGRKNEALKVFGVDGFVTKPREMSSLIKLVNRFTEESR